MSGRQSVKLVQLQDSLTDRSWEVHASMLGALRLSGRANGVLVYRSGRDEKLVPLDIRPFAADGVRTKFPGMFRDAAELVGLRPAAPVAPAGSPGCGGDPAFRDSWLKTVVSRLGAVRPAYCVFAAERRFLQEAKIGFGSEASSRAAENALVIAGLNAARTFVIETPFRVANRMVAVGEPSVLDSVLGQDIGIGLLTKIYAPGVS